MEQAADIETIEAYDQYAPTYGINGEEKKEDEKDHIAYKHFLAEQMSVFQEYLMGVGTQVLDLGSGPGFQAKQLRDEYHLSVVCVDASEKMVLECLEKGLEARQMDFGHLDIPDASVDGIWMSFALHHVQPGYRDTVLQEMFRVLKPGGIVYVSVFEGDGEARLASDQEKFGAQRYFYYYTSEELMKALSNHFEVLVQTSFHDGSFPRVTLAALCRKAL